MHVENGSKNSSSEAHFKSSKTSSRGSYLGLEGSKFLKIFEFLICLYGVIIPSTNINVCGFYV
jgi:hypothetical protein